MYINNYLSLQKRYSFREKQRYVLSRFGGLFIAAGNQGHIAARNYYSSTRDELDFQYLEDIYGMQIL
jgi:hypothetical protein